MKEIQGSTFCRKQGAGIGADLAKNVVGGNPVAIGSTPDDSRIRIKLENGLIEPGRAAQNAWLAGNHGGLGNAPGGNQFGGNVAGTDILKQGGIDVAGNFRGEREIKFDGHGSVESACWERNCTV